MDKIPQYLALADGLFTAIQRLVPILEERLKDQNVTPEQQAELQKRIDAIRDGSAFSGPEWNQR